MARLDIVARIVDKTRGGARKAEGTIDRLKRRIGGVGQAAKTAALGIAGIAAAGAAAAGALIGNMVSSARELTNLSERIGVSAGALEIWGRIAEKSGGSAEDVADAVREMNLRLAEAEELQSGPAVDALNVLGVSLEELGDKTPAERFIFLRNAISEVEDPAKRAFLAEELLGGASERLAGFVGQSTDAFVDNVKAVSRSGELMGGEGIAAANKFGLEFDKTKQMVIGLVQKALLPLLPVLTKVAQWVTEKVVPAVQSIIEQIGDDSTGLGKTLNTIKSIFEVVFKVVWEVVKAAVGFVVNDLKFLWTTISGIVKLVTAIFRGDWSAAWQAVKDIARGALDFLVTKVKLAIGLVTGVFKALGVNLGEVFSGIWDTIVGVAKSIRRLFIEVIPHNLKIGVNRIIAALEAIPNAFISGLNAVIRAWNNFSINTPAVKILGKTVVPAVSFNTPNIPTVPKVRIPRLRDGGVIQPRPGGRLFVGGDGGEAEVVAPLSKLGGKTEINLNARVELDGREIGRVVVEDWNIRNLRGELA